MLKRLMLFVIFLCLPVVGAAQDYQLGPLNRRYYSDTSFCAAPYLCVFSGAQVGLWNPNSSLGVPYNIRGIDISNFVQGDGDITEFYGMYGYQRFQTGDNLFLGVGSLSAFDLTDATANSLYHYRGTSTVTVGDIGVEIFLNFLPSPETNVVYTLLVTDPRAILRNDGPMDMGGGLGTATPAATPTATSVTPTPTGVTPTPAPTSTPPHLVKGKVHLDGDLDFQGDAGRTIKVGPCTKSPCLGRGLSLFGGAARGAKSGGAAVLQGGSGGVFGQVGGDASVIGGSGGANVILTAGKGFGNVQGRIYADGDLVSRLPTSGSAPTIGTCGTGPSMASPSTNNSGIINVGTGAVLSCALTFGNGGFLTNAPACIATNRSAIPVVLSTTATTTTMTISAGASLGGDSIAYICMGRE